MNNENRLSLDDFKLLPENQQQELDKLLAGTAVMCHETLEVHPDGIVLID